MNLNDEKMNIQHACEILEIDLSSLLVSELTKDYIKRKYHKLALKWHPDKNSNIYAKHKFQKINEAYEYLMKELTTINGDYWNPSDIFVSSSSFQDTNNQYIQLVSIFISSIIKGNYKEVLIKVVKDIVINGYKKISAKIFEDLDKDTSIEIYNFLNKYKSILHISQETLDFVSSFIKEKYKNDYVIILNPSIDDLLDSNIYKLYINNELYLVPLWHNELYFDNTASSNSSEKEKDLDIEDNKNKSNASDIIVLCNPELPENIYIDDDNNIYIELFVRFTTDLFIKNTIIFSLGSKEYTIPCNKLYIKKMQKYIFKKQGISKIDEFNIYNVNNKSDIIVNIIFE